MSETGMVKGVIISFTPWQEASETLDTQFLQLDAGPIHTDLETFQNTAGLWVQP